LLLGLVGAWAGSRRGVRVRGDLPWRRPAIAV